MSSLTTAEQTAGISRKALATLAGTNGRKTISEIISACRATHVLDTPMRLLDVLEYGDGSIWLRDTDYSEARASVARIHLDYHEAHALASVLRDLEPPDEPKNGKGRA